MANEELDERKEKNKSEVVETGKEIVKEQAQKQIKKKTQEVLKKEAAKAGAKATGKVALSGSGLAALGPILFWAIVIILAIIIIVGIIMFFMTMPGIVTEQLKDMATSFVKQIAGFYGADTTAMVEEEEKYEVLDYLEQMGYDLKGFGFISKDANKNDANYDVKQGVIRHSDTGLIKEAYTDIIGLYLMSDNYVYTVKNFNPTGILAYLSAVLKTTHPIIWNYLENVAKIDETAWGKGLITIKFEDGTDYQKNLVDQLFGTNTSWLNIKISPEAKTLGIRRGWGANYYEYNLDGWTGRYGMPIEFLLSVHIATMKPDLAYEMVTTYETNIDMRLKDVGGKIDALYKNNSGSYISYREVESLIHIGASDDVVTAVINWFDDWRTGNEEVARLFGLGFEHVCQGTEDECDLSGEEKTMDIVDENGNPDTITYTKAKNISQACKDNILAIIAELKSANDYNFDTYVPYIKNVTDHWFRDVYFVLSQAEVNSIRLTRTDIDYEKMTNERWTEYEKYESGDKLGEYKLYIYDKDKSEDEWELYTKSKEEADKEGVTVVKKQVKTYASDLENDGLLTLKDDGSWSAYEIKDTHSESFKRVWPEIDESTIKGRIYYKETMDSNVVQKYDGLRGVTNPTIKEMFLGRNYFSYDGNPETASVIKKLRDDVLGMDYGSIDDSELDTEFSVDIDVPNENGALVSKTVTGKISDYTSNVSITQDSLAAFSMLENTHTQDSDFIYKDFKELIVELGYFEKEDLSDGRKRLLQWLIPEIGSSGYPKRVLDKRENDYGTLAHSKEDYEINEKNTIQAMLNEFYNSNPEVNVEASDSNAGNPTLSAMNRDLYNKLGASVDQFIGNPGTKDSSLSGITVNEFLEAGRKICEYMDQVGYDYCVYNLSENCTTCQTSGSDACSSVHCSHTVKGNSCGLPITFEESKSLTNVCCATLVSWVLREVGVNMDDCQNQNSAQGVAEYCVEELGGKVITSYAELEPGDILAYVRPGGGDIGHVDILAEKSGDGFKKYNGGHPISSTQSSINNFNEASFNSNDLCFGIRLFGNKDEGAVYEGYRGNEAVVSPVTGILLEYGTYTEEDEKYRENLDKTDETDKVGYAKILVLDEEIGDQLVSCSKHGTSGKVSVDESEIKDTEEFDKLSDAQKALYGYQFFKEDYETGKIGGYLLYIDGFKCELPGEVNEETLEDENKQIEIITPGETLSMDYFKQKAAKGSGSNFVACTYEQTLYEPEEVYNLISDELEERQKAEIAAKENATLLYSFTGIRDGEEEEMLIIKEGTVIGRTLTDKELVEEYRGDTYISKEDAIETVTDPNTGETKEVDTREVIGNYLRIIMRDLDDTVVENVEDYMKLDEVPEYEQSDWELFFWLPFESGAADGDGCGPESQGTCSGGETAVGIIQWTVLARDYHDDDKNPSTPTDQDNGDRRDMNNIANQFIPACLAKDSSLCAPLAEFQSWSANDFWLDYDGGGKRVQSALSSICDTDRDAFLFLQMEIAKEQYLQPIIDAYPWLAERRSCVQGAVMHLAVWGANYDWISSYESKSDEEIVLKVRNTIANTSSTAGEATGDETRGRAYNEPEIALRIISGEIDVKNIEPWVRTDDTSYLGFDFKY